MYVPNLGWVQRDPLGYTEGSNLYQYADNKPTTTTDPTGEGWKSVLCKIACGVLGIILIYIAIEDLILLMAACGVVGIVVPPAFVPCVLLAIFGWAMMFTLFGCFIAYCIISCDKWFP